MLIPTARTNYSLKCGSPQSCQAPYFIKIKCTKNPNVIEKFSHKDGFKHKTSECFILMNTRKFWYAIYSVFLVFPTFRLESY